MVGYRKEGMWEGWGIGKRGCGKGGYRKGMAEIGLRKVRKEHDAEDTRRESNGEKLK